MATFKRKKPGENPFRPGFGEPPPFLAGRQAEQGMLGARIDGLAGGGARRPFIIYGPRGMGKTALLDWIAEECPDLGGRTWTGRPKLSVIIARAPDMLGSEESAMGVLLPAKAGRKAMEIGAKAGVGGLGGTVKMHPPGIGFINAGKPIIAACKKRPLLLLIDEAHVVRNREVYQDLLNLTQAVIREAPLLLVLAGTPDLPDALNSVSATFVSRAQLLGVGLLEKDEAEKAIRQPLAANGIHIDDDALSLAAEDAQRYPYFLQVWGAALWDTAMAHGKSRLSMRDAEAARRAAQKDKIDYYEDHYSEVHEDKLTKTAAVAVADAFARAERYKIAQLHEIVENALSPLSPQGEAYRNAREQFKTLLHLGFVWRKPGESVIGPGIPSLMDYIAHQIREERPAYTAT